MLRYIGIIPARFASTRFPGKPLALVNGIPMIQRVFQQASSVFEVVYVATDDERIAEVVSGFGGKVVMTSSAHPSGTDRICEALEKIESELNIQFDVVVNIQGDEPYIDPNALKQITGCFNDNNIDIATLGKPMHVIEDVLNPNHVKLVRDKFGKALYFSRSPIPYIRNYSQEMWIEKHTFLKHLVWNKTAGSKMVLPFRWRLPITKVFLLIHPKIWKG
jgi:3-deoxy-manno-octulosonate cytidylyltransferase (CMP-KDO synthetase)